MEIKLKPCPFCWQKAMEVENWKIKGGILYGVRCVHCHAVTGYYEDEKDAFKAWNKRAEPENVVHARWVTDDFTKLISCSACGFDTGVETTSGKQWEAPYCWYCGAKMDEEV